MDKTLYALFFLTMPAAFFGLLANGVSLAVSLMLFGPVAVAVFTASAFVVLLGAVVLEKTPGDQGQPRVQSDTWLTKPKLQHSNS
ncbi:MAG: hypothetical protein NXH78_12335 [Hyphomonadaceae bacterium]|nr:hypothetical protein [Hyphomonadaceae bacterium]